MPLSPLVILLLLAALQTSTSQVTPVSELVAKADTSLPLCVGTLSGQRRVIDIGWSCFATIIACTWFAVHPNIPAPMDSFWRIGWRRVELMISAIIAPEVVILWTFRQWYYARKIGKFYELRGWTSTHGFFVQMGGFVLHDGDEPQGIMSFNTFHKLIREERIDFPRISEEDIQDRSKGDSLSKGIVILQTSWFTLQCIARYWENLPLTELELVTLAFAALNGITYYLWWNKPLNVTRQHVIYLREDKDHRNVCLGSTIHLFLTTVDFRIENADNGDPEKICISKEIQVHLEPVLPQSWLRRQFKKAQNYFSSTLGIILSPLGALGEMADGDCSIPRGARRAPKFYAETMHGIPGDSHLVIEHARRLIFLGPAIITVCFGAIHCIGWKFDFPSRREWVLWQISSIVIVGVSALFLLYATLEFVWSSNEDYPEGLSGRSRLIRQILQVLCFFSIYLYIPARFFLIIEALYSLRDLPSGAYQTTRWTIYMPNFRF